MIDLCAPCIVEEPKKEIGTIKAIKYTVQKDNAKDIIDRLKEKNCIPNFQELSGNADPKTANDRFNLESYEDKIESIMNAPLIEAPGEPED